MNCCKNRAIRSINYERVCVLAVVLYMIMNTFILFEKIYHFIENLVYKRKKYLRIQICFHIRAN